MAGSYTDYMEEQSLRYATGGTPAAAPGTVWVALLGASPGETAPGTAGELTGANGLTRQPTTGASWTYSGGSAVLAGTLNFGTTSANAGTAAHCAGYPTSTGGTALWYADMGTAVVLASAGIAYVLDPTNRIAITHT